ncbi:MarR family winged helix-turn-helix transcriptional regulator [Demequina capsici]|uniref:MarR family transcriptional regulator n=1 Tax=Demequina capsici TaxID=3075620 RepID=A0AA96J838_9MICO|nr:MarR family transcriptional regulator [Demequina sp. OYTSA14]WNM25842.1 MarR family transcriptional regulator [Demequina sp. OYTSA14]
MTAAIETQLSQPERVAIARLHALLELLPAALDKQLAAIGLTAFEFTLLEALDESPSGRVRLGRLAARTNATLPRLSRVVTGLERKGLVVREPCPEDGRAFNAVLTPQGRDTFQDARPQHAHAVRAMVLEDLSVQDVDELAALCLKILGRLDPDHRMDVTACLADPAPSGATVAECDADPTPACDADPRPSA